MAYLCNVIQEIKKTNTMRLGEVTQDVLNRYKVVAFQLPRKQPLPTSQYAKVDFFWYTWRAICRKFVGVLLFPHTARRQIIQKAKKEAQRLS